MADGPTHYGEAERLLDAASDVHPSRQEALLAQAQVEATLALAATAASIERHLRLVKVSE